MNAAEELLKDFAADRQVAGFAIDGEGVGGVTVDGRVQVDLKADGNRLFVYGSLGPVPSVDEETVLAVLLAANRAGSIGEGPVMSIDPALGDIVVSQEIDARTAGSATVLRAIGAIAEQVEAWTRRLSEIGGLLKERPAQEDRSERLAFLINRA